MTKFKGWDYTEVCEALGAKIKRNEMGGEEKAIKFARRRINKSLDRMPDGLITKAEKKEAVKVEKICRSYIKALAGASKRSYEHKLWVGLSKVKDGWTFLRFFSELLGFMWT